MFLAFCTATLFVLWAGDFLATFVYHVPEHVFGRYHVLVHHRHAKRSFTIYSLENRNLWALANVFLNLLCYLLPLPLGWMISPQGAVAGLILAKLHSHWRHTAEQGPVTPKWLQTLSRRLGIITPEQHWLHHCNGNAAYGDIFWWHDRPARLWLKVLRRWKRQMRRSQG